MGTLELVLLKKIDLSGNIGVGSIKNESSWEH